MPSLLKCVLAFAAVPLVALATPISTVDKCAEATKVPATPTAPEKWVHPGVLVSGSQLDFVKQQVAAKKDPWYTAYKAMLDDPLVKNSTTPSPVPTVACGYSSINPDIGCHQETENALTAYANALAFWISGDTKYASMSIKFMDAWANTLKAHADPKTTGSGNTQLQTGWAGAPWSRAADLIKHANDTRVKWEGADAFGKMLRNIYVPWIYNGSTTSGNWELVMMEALQGIAVFLEDKPMYDHAMQLYMARVPAYIYLASDGDLPVPGHGVGKDRKSIVSYWHNQTVFDKRVNGVAQETCRDLAHAGFGVSSITHIAETSRIQGNDLYGTEIGTRIRYGLEFNSAFAGNYSKVPDYLCGGVGAVKNPAGWGPITEVGLNAMAFRRNDSMPDTQKWAVAHRPTGQNRLFIGWETLTHAENKA